MCIQISSNSLFSAFLRNKVLNVINFGSQISWCRECKMYVNYELTLVVIKLCLVNKYNLRKGAS